MIPAQRRHAERIMRVVARAWDVQVADLRARDRHERIVPARQVAVYLVRERLQLSLPAIGRLFGRDHTTILRATRRAPRYLETPPARRVLQVLAQQDALAAEAREEAA